jgi:hypothetical protein
MERREKLDLVQNKYTSGKVYHVYNKENEPSEMKYNRYMPSEKHFSSKLNSDLNENFTRALARVGLKTTAAALNTGVPCSRVRNIDTEVTRKLSHMR